MIAFKLDVPYQTVLFSWAVMLLIAAGGLAGLAALARRGPSDGSRPQRRRRPSREEFGRLHAEARELGREAAAAAAKASHSRAWADAALTRWVETQAVREAALGAFDAAQRAYDQASAAFRVSEAERAERARGEAEQEREHEVSRAALAAYRRGDLSVDELREVFRRAGGWDPQQEQWEREVALLRAEAQRAHRAYDAAVVAERVAGKAATVAEVAAHALAEEAEAASAEATAAQALVERWSRRASRWLRR